MIRGHPIHSRHDTAPCTAARAIEYAYRDHRYALRHTPRTSAHRAGHVRAVSVAIIRRTTVNCVIATARATPKVRQPGVNTCVDDVGADTSSGIRVAVRGAQRQSPLVNAIESPRRA